jgi:integrase
MSVMVQCPICKQKQKLANKVCRCGEDLNQAKRSRRAVYWITYRVPGSRKKYWQQIGDSLTEAQDADSKRKVQKREHRIFDMVPMAASTFNDLFDWYLKLDSVKSLAMNLQVNIHAAHFKRELGNLRVTELKKSDLAGYQAKLKKEGYSPSYIDQIIGTAKAAVTAAWDDGKVSGDCLRPFRRVKKALKRGSNARDMVITHAQYERLMAVLSPHLAPIFATDYWTGMREGEILSLTWDKLDLRGRWIYLDEADTKDQERRRVPIPPPLYEILKRIRRSIRTPFVFLYRDERLADIREAMRRGCKRAGIPYGRFTPDGFVFHDLRHTYVTHLKRAGVDTKVVMAMTGHGDEKTMNLYRLVDASDAKSANEKLLEYRGVPHTPKS